jgi:hypothetical protein
MGIGDECVRGRETRNGTKKKTRGTRMAIIDK